MVGAGARPAGACSAGGPVPVDRAVACSSDLVDVAIATGASLPRALSAVGAAVGGAQGDALARGGPRCSSARPGSRRGPDRGAALTDVVGALEAAGPPARRPDPRCAAGRTSCAGTGATRARTAAGALGVHLVLPLGLCFLPAFVLLGLVPMILSLAGDLFG